MSGKKVYIIGIEGAGTSALAMLYKKKGYEVSGSDDGDGFYHEVLSKAGVKVFKDFKIDHITDDYDFFVHSTAFNESNIEIQACKHKGFTIISYPQAIGKLTKEFYTIAVCGTHGKTTTTGYVTHGLIGSGRDVNAIIGAPVVGWGSGARVGTSEEFILEADEYQNKLALYKPQSVILTSIDYDHPDFFPDYDSYKQVFTDFITRIPRSGLLVAHYQAAKELDVNSAISCNLITYGQDIQSDAILLECKVSENKQEVVFSFKQQVHSLTTTLPGSHNALNAIAAWLMASHITKNAEGSTEGIASFKGVARRFERHDNFNDSIRIDDYAHHPAEIRTTLTALKALYPHREIIAAFHPHTYTRTKELLDEFAKALEIADQVIVLDIYGSAREVHGGVHAIDLVNVINQGVTQKAIHLKNCVDLANFAKETLSENDVFITMGAGDIYKVHEMLKTKH